MGNPFDVGVIRSLERSTGKHIRVAAADPADIAQLVERVYGAAELRSQPWSPAQAARQRATRTTPCGRAPPGR